ncbi:MAG: tetratricopeptide repeat protein [Aggregatilineales bacterium]
MLRKTSQPTDDYGRAEVLLARATAAYRTTQYLEALAYAQDALQLAQQNLEHEPRWAVLLDQAYKRMTECHDRRTNFTEMAQVLEAWAGATKRPEGKVENLALWARMYYRRGDYEQAFRALDEGASLAQACGYAAGLATVLRFRADVLWLSGEVERAISTAQQALVIFERVDNLEGRARTLNTLGISYTYLGDYYQAIVHWLRAIQLYETLDERFGLSVICSNTGEAYQSLYAMRTALFYHQRASDLLEGKLTSDLARNLGVDLVAVGRIEEGLAHLQRAVQIARENGEMDNLLQALASLAEAYWQIEDWQKAEPTALELLTLAQARDAKRHLLRAELVLGYCALAAGDLTKAQEFFHEAFVESQATSDRSLIWRTHAALADAFSQTQPDTAAMHYSIAADILNQIAKSIGDLQLRETFCSAPLVAKVLSAAARSCL